MLLRLVRRALTTGMNAAVVAGLSMVAVLSDE